MKDTTELSVSTPMDELERRILEENDQVELQNAINLFNMNIKKKEIVRNSTLSNLQDKALEQISKRLETKAGEFSNKDLLDFYKVLRDSCSSASDMDNIPSIQITQQNLNIGSGAEFDRQSRERIADAVRSILDRYGGEIPTEE